MLLGKCADQAEMERRISNYHETNGIPRENIRIHPDNGGDPLAYGYVYLGIPVGSEQFRRHQLRALIDAFIQLCECDVSVSSPQERWVYLYWVIRQKFPYWLRHMAPSITTGVATDIDDLLRAKLNKIIGEPISDLTWDQARLPIKSHGFGLGHTMSAACVANALEMMKAVQDKLPSATCLDHLDDAQEELDAIRLGFTEIKEYVDAYRTHMLKIEETASRAEVSA